MGRHFEWYKGETQICDNSMLSGRREVTANLAAFDMNTRLAPTRFRFTSLPSRGSNESPYRSTRMGRRLAARLA